MKKSTKLLIALPVLILASVLLTLLADTVLKDSGIAALVTVYILFSKVILMGYASNNAKFLQNSKYPTILCYIPYVQTIMWLGKSTLWLGAIYALSLLVFILSPLVLLSDMALNIVGFASADILIEYNMYVMGVSFIIFRLASGFIYSKALSTMTDTLDTEIADRAWFLKILDIPKKLSAFLPFLSLWMTVSLTLESMKMVSLKRRTLAQTKSRTR